MQSRASFVLVLSVLAGCASGGATGSRELDPSTLRNHYLSVENMTVDVVRVYLELPDGFAILLGRVDPMGRAQLRVPRALYSNTGSARLAAVPVGAALERVPGPGSPSLRSDSYPVADLVQSGWRLSNTRILMTVLPR
jgi:hypothetical protein